VVENKVQQWPIDQLKRFERQDANFHDLNAFDLSLLADDMKANGQTTPIEILPDGTVIDGHQRLRAAKVLHWPEVRVRVRDDLKGKRAAERRMLEANLTRRQLHPLDRIRIAKRFLELEQRSRSGDLSPSQKQGLTADLSKKLGMCRRNVRRWLSVLEAPMAVQRAVQEGRLNLVDGEKVARMDTESQQRIAEAIDRGEDPRSFVGEESTAKPKTTDVNKEFGKFIDFVGARLDGLESGAASLKRGSNSEQDLEIVLRFETLLRTVKPVLEQQARRSREAKAEFTRTVADMQQGLMRRGAPQ
jgi:ParB/RepB/Spo0J family partition protein